MFQNCNATRVVTGGVKGPIDGQCAQVLHFR